MIELTFLKELMLKRQANQKSVIFVTIGIFQIKGLRFYQMSAMGKKMMSMNLSDIPTLNIKGADYGCIISGISKFKAIELTEQVEKVEHYKL